MEAYEFAEWRTKHAAIFQWPDAAATLDTWKEVFDANGYTIEELRNATSVLASSVPMPPRWDHLQGIHQIIRAGRKTQHMHNETQNRLTADICDICRDGRGWVIVPHLQSVHDGKWAYPWPNCTVVCSCSFGSRIAESWNTQTKNPQARSMRLPQYEAKNPDWVRQLRERRKADAAEAKLHTVEREGNPTFWQTALDAAVGRVTANATPF